MESLRRGWTVYLFNLKHLVEHHLAQSGGQHYATLVTEGVSAKELWERVGRLVSPSVKPGARVTLAGVAGEIVLHEPGAVLGLKLDTPEGALLQVIFEDGMLMPGLFVQAAPPESASDAWQRIVTALHNACVD